MTSTTKTDFHDEISSFVLKWTPRSIAMIVGGYYGLGIGYDWGLLAQIDRIAIDAIKYFVGYVGVGALMPTVQWYTAWGVRILFALAAGLIYDLAERCIKFLIESTQCCYKQ